MPKRVLYLLLCILLISQVYFFFKDDYLDRIYLSFAEEKKAPLPLPKYWMSRNEVFNDSLIDSNAIVFIGDSQTQLFELNDYFKSTSVFNRGILSDVILGVKNRLSVILAKQPKSIYLMIGVNDVMDGKTQTQINKELDILTGYLASKATHTSIVFQSILPLGENRYLTTLENYQRNLKSLNTKIIHSNNFLKAKCAKYGFQYLDLHSAFYAKHHTIDSLFLKDGIHLSKKGYALWAKQLHLE